MLLLCFWGNSFALRMDFYDLTLVCEENLEAATTYITKQCSLIFIGREALITVDCC